VTSLADVDGHGLADAYEGSGAMLIHVIDSMTIDVCDETYARRREYGMRYVL
jgi:hypothetical protein